MILLGYEYEVVDDNGNYPKAVPDQDRNDLLQVSYPPAWNFKSLILCFFSSLVAAHGRPLLSEIHTHRRVVGGYIKYLIVVTVYIGIEKKSKSKVNNIVKRFV